MFLVGINNIDPIDFGITLTLSIRLSWRDDRIKRPDETSVSISLDMLKKFWIPDFYIYDLRNFKILRVMQDLQGGITITPKGENKTGYHILKD